VIAGIFCRFVVWIGRASTFGLRIHHTGVGFYSSPVAVRYCSQVNEQPELRELGRYAEMKKPGFRRAFVLCSK
jgi:hypothetical protein